MDDDAPVVNLTDTMEFHQDANTDPSPAHDVVRREPALSGRPATPPTPSGESEEEGGDTEGDASPAPAPQPMRYLQPMTYLRSMEGPLALLTGKVLRDRAPQRCGELRRELALSGRPHSLRPTAVGKTPAPDLAGDGRPPPANE